MYVVDTNVFVYAAGREHPLRRPAHALIEAAAEGRVRITTTAEVVQEFLHVRATRTDRAEAARQAAEVAAMSAPLLGNRDDDVAGAIQLFVRHPMLNAFDALLAAVATREEIAGLISADRGFAGVPGLRWIDLSELEVDVL